ncbi:MAG: hypothetical protein Q8L53_16645 [Aestuariivirga sp.]|nr:hypothetical protein [Aestuariivirga sp.]
MDAYLWIAGIGLFAVAAGAVFMAFRNPAFIAGLVKVAATAIFNAMLPAIAKRMPPDEEAAWNKFNRSSPDKDEIRAWKKAYRKRQKAKGQ